MSEVEKSQRSVFVGNIPYEATEEKLKEIFSEVGPVLSFKVNFYSDVGCSKLSNWRWSGLGHLQF